MLLNIVGVFYTIKSEDKFTQPWEQIDLNIEEYYGKVSNEVLEVFQCLNTKMSNEDIVSNITKLIKLLRR